MWLNSLYKEIMFEQLALKRPADEELGETMLTNIHNEHSAMSLSLHLKSCGLKAEVLALHFNVPTETKGLELEEHFCYCIRAL